MKDNAKEKLAFANWLRVIAAFMILMCHYMHHNNSSFANVFNQFFALGVEIFFVLSGFLFGTQGMIQNAWKWYKKRWERIYVPLELFVLILALIYLASGESVLSIDWLRFMMRLSGDQSSILEARHTWFITSLILCYLITPLLSVLAARLRRGTFPFAVILLIAMTVPMNLIATESVLTVFEPVIWYTIAYLSAFVQYKKVKTSIRGGVTVFCVLSAILIFRMVIRNYIDGTILYDRLVVGYTSWIASFCILYLFACIFHKPNKVVNHVSAISFEIYLWHYIFSFGKVSLFGLTPNWITDCIVVTATTFAVSYIMNMIGCKIIEKINCLESKHDS